MQLRNEFSVAADLDRAWRALTDIPALAECIPGAHIDGQDGDTYAGHVTVKVGAVGLTLHGAADLVRCDVDQHLMVVRGSARDRKGQGSVEALITVTASAAGQRTDVTVTTELDLGGRVAQFGAGVVNQVSRRIIGQFVRRLDAMIAGTDPHTTPTATAAEPVTIPASMNRTLPTWRVADGIDTAIAMAGGIVLGLAIGRAIYSPVR
ncbi:SRPBCC family protein [Nocardia sp. KC 131]|uniref:SRPBCC family protein n=1 Tax=Nocardia arseniciresistens TaxID=3392119 RepID=UPI00398F34BF